MLPFALLLGLSGFARIVPEQPCEERALSTYPVPRRYSLDAILEAVRAIETGGETNGGRDAIGDGGRAIGPYQIHRAYFVDAGVAGRYDDCRDPDYSRRVVLAYWTRWCPDALEHGDAEVLARTHNGGPEGARKPGTLVYWLKVEERLVTLPIPSRGAGG